MEIKSLYQGLLDLFLFRYRFVLKARDQIVFPYFSELTIRGALGWALRKICCPEDMQSLDCKSCQELQRCAYPFLFKTVIKSDAPGFLKKYQSPPPPYILNQVQINLPLFPGDRFLFDLVLVGEANKFLPLILFAVQKMGEMGLGGNMGQFILESLQCLYPDSSYEEIFSPDMKGLNRAEIPTKLENFFGEEYSCDQVTLNFFTPLRLYTSLSENSGEKKELKKIPVSRPEFSFLISRMLERVYLLSAYYCKSLNTWEPDFSTLIEWAKDIKVKECSLRYFPTHKENLGGFLGSITYEGELTPFLPLLKLSQILHVGKAASFGFGGYFLAIRRKPLF